MEDQDWLEDLVQLDGRNWLEVLDWLEEMELCEDLVLLEDCNWLEVLG